MSPLTLRPVQSLRSECCVLNGPLVATSWNYTKRSRNYSETSPHWPELSWRHTSHAQKAVHENQWHGWSLKYFNVIYLLVFCCFCSRDEGQHSCIMFSNYHNTYTVLCLHVFTCVKPELTVVGWFCVNAQSTAECVAPSADRFLQQQHSSHYSNTSTVSRHTPDFTWCICTCTKGSQRFFFFFLMHPCDRNLKREWYEWHVALWEAVQSDLRRQG